VSDTAFMLMLILIAGLAMGIVLIDCVDRQLIRCRELQILRSGHWRTFRRARRSYEP
jgi:hypothetical protein